MSTRISTGTTTSHLFGLWVLAAGSCASTAMAQSPKDVNATVPVGVPIKAGAPGTGEATFLKITIDASRTPVTMDTEAGVSAEIKNVSAVAVKLSENETIFVTMPETRIYGETKGLVQGCATFPTQGNHSATSAGRGSDILIPPGDSYRVFWDMTVNGCTNQPQERLRLWTNPIRWLEEKWQRMMFAPGTYKVYLDVVFYPQGGNQYHTATEGRDVLVSASQQMVLLGAFLGGLLAYWIKLYYGIETQLTVKMPDGFPKRIIEKTEWLNAGLFAAAMVILAARLSDTFPVKINANDFWGSITLGFVFQWIGVKMLEKLPGVGPTRAA